MPSLRSTGLMLLCLLAPLPGWTAPSCGVSDLAWMQGTWRSTRDTTTGEEHWVSAGKSLVGSGWEAKDGTVNFSEAESIVLQGDKLELHLRHFDGPLNHAWEEKDSPMVFVFASCTGQTVVFDGTGPKVGEHISYRRDGNTLTFVGDFLRKGQPFHVEVAMTKATD